VLLAIGLRIIFQRSQCADLTCENSTLRVTAVACGDIKYSPFDSIRCGNCNTHRYRPVVATQITQCRGGILVSYCATRYCATQRVVTYSQRLRNCRRATRFSKKKFWNPKSKSFDFRNLKQRQHNVTTQRKCKISTSVVLWKCCIVVALCSQHINTAH